MSKTLSDVSETPSSWTISGPDVHGDDTDPVLDVHQSDAELYVLPESASDREKSSSVDPEKGDSAVDANLDSKRQTVYDYPEGGRAGWLTVLGYFCVAYVTWGVVSSFGSFQAYLTATRLPQNSQSQVAWIGALQIFCLYSLSICGKFFDRGYHRQMIVVGSLLYITCTFLLELCDELWQLILCQGFGIGIGMGLLFLPAVSAVGHFFSKKRALAIGIGATGSSLGAVTIPIQLRRMFASNGWATATRTLGATTTVALIVALLCTRTRLPPKTGGRMIDFRLFKDVSYSAYTLGIAMGQLGLYIPMFFGPEYALSKGIGQNLAYYVVAILGAGSVFGRLVPNYIADKIGILNVLLFCLFVSGILQFCWLACSSPAAIIIFNILYGFTSGGFVSGTPAGVAVLTPDMRDFGLRNGMLFLFCAPFGLAGAPAGGALSQQSFASAAAFGGAAVLVGAALLAWVRWRETRRRGTWII